MKTRSHTLLPLLLTAFLAFGACSSSVSTATSEQGAGVETKEEAIAIALNYLNQQPYAEQYEKTGIQQASKAHSYQGLLVHAFGRLAAAMLLLAPLACLVAAALLMIACEMIR